MGDKYLNVRAHVHFRDGTLGTLHRVVLDPNTNCVTDLVVVRGLVPRHEHVVPVALTELISPQHIEARLFTDQWAVQPEYHEIEFEERIDDRGHNTSFPSRPVLIWNPIVGIYQTPKRPVPGVHRKVAEGIPANEVVIGHSSKVRNLDGVVGQVDYLLLNSERWEVTHLIVRQSLLPHHAVIPLTWLRDVMPDEIFIQGNTLQLNQLPRVHGSILETPPSYWKAANNATEIGMEQIVADEIAEALAENQRTIASVIEVIFEQGVVTLKGTVDSPQAHQAAAEIAQQHPHIVSVVNALEVQPARIMKPYLEDALDVAIAQVYGAKGSHF